MAWQLSTYPDEGGATCAQQIAGLQQAGINRLDIRMMDGFNISVMPLDHAKRVREQLDAAGLSCAMFGSPIGKIDLGDDFNIDVEKLRHLAALAPVLNCRVVRIFSYFNRKAAAPYDAYRKEALRRLRELKAVAKDLGLILYHENETAVFGDRADDVLAIINELRDPPAASGGAAAVGSSGTQTFRSIFDFGNFNAGRENVWDNWVKLRDFTDAIHLKDSLWTAPAPEGEVHYVPAGQGNCFVREILADAVKRRFSGPISIESHLGQSAAVAPIGPTGIPNQMYSAMSTDLSFQIACAAGKAALIAAGAVLD
jgi:sugar phosphate isomerase/epimerase